MISFSPTLPIFIFSALMLPACSGSQQNQEFQQSDRVDGPGSLAATVPVLFDQPVTDQTIRFEPTKRGVPDARLAHVRLHISGIPEIHEGTAFTLIGGGLDGRGFHGPESTKFEGAGYHFARSEEGTDESIKRTDAYKQDYTRTVENGRLQFDIYFEPSNINQWGERYFPGCEVALTMMQAGMEKRVLHASNNIYNWAIAGVGTGKSADIFIELE